MRRTVIAVLVVTLLLGTVLLAGELAGVTMPDQVTVGEHTLTLNGMGLRTKKVLFIGVKVYVAGLYLPQKSSDPASIITSDEPKQIVMHFLYKDVGKKKLVEAWNEGFEANAPVSMDALKSRLATFNGYWSDMKTGDVAVLTYVPGQGTKVEIKGKDMGTIKGLDFAEALFSVWLGPQPPNGELKEGLLGKSSGE